MLLPHLRSAAHLTRSAVIHNSPEVTFSLDISVAVVTRKHRSILLIDYSYADTPIMPSANTNRSRRKSCKACAESKVKCDLQQPCTKCKARNRECIYVTPPNGVAAATGFSSMTSAASNQQSQQRTQDESANSSTGSSSPALTFDAPSSVAYALIPGSSLSTQNSTATSSLSPPSDASSGDLPSIATPTSIFNSDPIDPNSAFERINYRPILDQSQLDNLTTNEMFDDLFSNVFTPNWQKEHNPAYSSPIPDFSNMSVENWAPSEGNYTPENTFPFAPDSDGRQVNPIFAAPNTTTLAAPPRLSPEYMGGRNTSSKSNASTATSGIPPPTEAELQSYRKLSLVSQRNQ